MQMIPLARDAATLARASWAVASSDTMARYREWMEWNDARRDAASRHNPLPGDLERAVAGVVRARVTMATESLPWNAGRSPASRRLLAALVSFVDDYGGAMPSEMFPREETHALRLALREAAGGGALTADEQLAIALDATGGELFAAAVLLHAVTRLVARNRDTRAVGALTWEERLADAAWIAPFLPEIAGKGDAPGDTYHYWANFVAGLHAELRKRIVPRTVGAVFLAGPLAMHLVRGRLFGATLFAGAHARCDWMGLRHGRVAARAARASS
jgi:hypothetical protein